MLLLTLISLNLLISLFTAIILWSLHFGLYYYFGIMLLVPRYIDFIPHFVFIVSFIATIIRYILTKTIEKFLIQKNIIKKKIIKVSIYVYIINIMFINIIIYSILFFIISNLECISDYLDLFFIIMYILFLYLSELIAPEFLMDGKEYMYPVFLYDKVKSYIHAMDISRLLNPAPTSPNPTPSSPGTGVQTGVQPGVQTGVQTGAGSSSAAEGEGSSRGVEGGNLNPESGVNINSDSMLNPPYVHITRVLDRCILKGSTTSKRDWMTHKFGSYSNLNPFFINIPAAKLPEGVSIVENKFVFSNNLQGKDYFTCLFSCMDLARTYPVFIKHSFQKYGQTLDMSYRFHKDDIDNLHAFRQANFERHASWGANLPKTSLKDWRALKSEGVKVIRKS